MFVFIRLRSQQAISAGNLRTWERPLFAQTLTGHAMATVTQEEYHSYKSRRGRYFILDVAAQGESLKLELAIRDQNY
jgi:hypothetical protein